MATIQFKAGDEYLERLSKLEALAKEEVCGKAIYGAAAIVADEIRSSLDRVPTDNRQWAASGDELQGPTKYQKEGLSRSLGVSKMKDDGSGYLNVKIGFDGYNGVKTKRWPNGQPNQMIARSVERGTSFMKANAFVKKAVSATKKRAVEVMKEEIDKATETIMKG